MNKRKRDNSIFEKKLGAYALAGAAVLAAPVTAKATIISATNINQTVNQPGSYALNLSGPASADITIKAEPDPYIGAFSNVDAYAGSGAGIVLDPAVSPPQATALAFGALIDPTSTANTGSFGKMASSFGGAPGDWSTTGGASYLGFYFTDTTGVHAGWAEISTTASESSSFEILGYAYETTASQTITAGQLTDSVTTPEPSSLALLALGGAGLLEYRRRRSANA